MQKKITKFGGARSRDRGVNRVRNWDRVRGGGGERVTLFEKHPPPQKKKSGKII